LPWNWEASPLSKLITATKAMQVSATRQPSDPVLATYRAPDDRGRGPARSRTADSQRPGGTGRRCSVCDAVQIGRSRGPGRAGPSTKASRRVATAERNLDAGGDAEECLRVLAPGAAAQAGDAVARGGAGVCGGKERSGHSRTPAGRLLDQSAKEHSLQPSGPWLASASRPEGKQSEQPTTLGFRAWEQRVSDSIMS